MTQPTYPQQPAAYGVPQPYPAPAPATQPAYAPAPHAAYPAAPAGYPPQPAYGQPPAPAPAGAYDLGQVNMTEGKNLLPLLPQPGQPPIQRLLALVSFVWNPSPPASKKGPRKPRYEAALTCVQSSVPDEVGQTFHLVLRAAMSQYDLQDFGIAADSRLTRQIVGAVNSVDPMAQADWAGMVNALQTRNFQAQPALVRCVSNAGRRAHKHPETQQPTGLFWPEHAYLPAGNP